MNYPSARASWVPLYQRYQEGQMMNAVVVFWKYPHIMHRELVKTEADVQTFRTRVEYEYRIYLNLWLVNLRFVWHR